MHKKTATNPLGLMAGLKPVFWCYIVNARRQLIA